MVEKQKKAKIRALPWPSYLLAIALIAVSGSCSLSLDWDPDGLRCANGESTLCGEGYSCLGGFCILDHSKAKGTSCLYDRQCESNLICAKGFYTCAEACTEFYEASETTCASNEYCQPIAVQDDSGDTYTYVGACIASTNDCTNTNGASQCCNEEEICCTNSQECQTGNVCVSIKSGAKACLTGCEFETPSSGGSTDLSTNCEPGGTLNPYCDYLGSSSEQLVCLGHPSDTFQGELATCNKVTSPCQEGHVCHNTLCHVVCSLTSPECGTSQTCCQVGDRTDYGLCSTDCDNI
ncbi:MAG: hypothetical protein CMH60_01145 [Myxococcales bacterium]|nr:hypothetical protein [Myxococcales bacterium]